MAAEISWGECAGGGARREGGVEILKGSRGRGGIVPVVTRETGTWNGDVGANRFLSRVCRPRRFSDRIIPRQKVESSPGGIARGGPRFLARSPCWKLAP